VVIVERIDLHAVVPVELDGQRLDQAAAKLFNRYSRSRIQQWIKSGQLLVDGQVLRPRDKILQGSELCVGAELEEEVEWQAESIDLSPVYEDDSLIVINKPAGLVVHPAAGHAEGTLVNALLHHCPDLAVIPRAGIVHRLDKDTSGLLVVAKTLPAHNSLISQLQKRSVKREYEAIVIGRLTSGGTVDLPIGRHPRQRQRMAVLEHGGKPAITHYRVIERFANHTHVRLNLETGRTHQIRVHMAHIRYPLVGDPVYAGRLKIPRGAGGQLRDRLAGFRRQALHARRLGLIHPGSGEPVEWEAGLPEDMLALLADLRANEQGVEDD
jgi:23S rRNA pseudouridine1911/1915/1917 synthase